MKKGIFSILLIAVGVTTTLLLVSTTTSVYGQFSAGSGDSKYDRALKESTDYFKQKNMLCSALEELGVLEDSGIPEDAKDIVTPEIYQDCRDFLYN